MSKRKQTLKKQILKMPGYGRMASGATMSEGFPSFIEQEEIYVDITNKVKPYTRSILLHVTQHGQRLGSIQMTRRP